MNTKRNVLSVLVCSLLLVSCSTTTTTQDEGGNYDYLTKNQTKVLTFSSEEDWKSFLEEQQTSMQPPFATSRAVETQLAMPMSEEAVGAGAPMIKTDSGTSADNASDDYSATNIQVEGVDEDDIVKTDGSYIYSISNNDIFIVKAYPTEEAARKVTMTIDDAPQGMYLYDQQLIVYGNDYNYYEGTGFSNTTATYLKVFDVSNPELPELVKEYDVEGTYVDSRMVGGTLLLVTSEHAYGDFYDLTLPRFAVDGEQLEQDLLSEKAVHYFDIPYQWMNMSQVSLIGFGDQQGVLDREVYIMENSQNLYVSTNNVYITYTTYVDEEALAFEVIYNEMRDEFPSDVMRDIKKIEDADAVVLTKNEKLQKKMRVLERYFLSLEGDEQKRVEERGEAIFDEKMSDIMKETEKTVIHKIAFSEGELEYKATGEVTGSVLNQFSMNEMGEYFALATTKNRSWSSLGDAEDKKSYNNLYVLDAQLNQVGALEDLARDERIYSVRFMQDRAYMVTFKQTDPLFVIDLSNPVNPTVLGELKIPGFSTYLHPYDQTHLLGIGRDADVNKFGGVQAEGVKIALFDVTDVTNPIEVDSYIIEGQGTGSDALYNHKAVLFSKEKNLLAFPITEQKDYGVKAWLGAYVFTITPEGIALRGKVSHLSDEEITSENETSSDVTISPEGSTEGRLIAPDRSNYPDYRQAIKRLLYISDVLYSMSDYTMKMFDLESLDEKGVILLKNAVEIQPEEPELLIEQVELE